MIQKQVNRGKDKQRMSTHWFIDILDGKSFLENLKTLKYVSKYTTIQINLEDLPE